MINDDLEKNILKRVLADFSVNSKKHIKRGFFFGYNRYYIYKNKFLGICFGLEYSLKMEDYSKRVEINGRDILSHSSMQYISNAIDSFEERKKKDEINKEKAKIAEKMGL
jgi:hypothetical protein